MSVKSMVENLYDEAYFKGKNSNYWWTANGYENINRFPHWEAMLKTIKQFKSKGGKLLDI